jgi:predicted XRE-type DNA-binding protein
MVTTFLGGRNVNTLREVLSHVNKLARISQIGECWEWMLSRTGDGYGQVQFRGKRTLVHRLVASMLVDDVCGRVVCHVCDNPPCCNPEHLFVGTNLDNQRDAKAKGRTWRPAGELNNSAKLTRAKVLEIRRLYSQGFTQDAIAKQFAVSQPVVSAIVNARLWAGLTES